jgi:hypothetical protein
VGTAVAAGGTRLARVRTLPALIHSGLSQTCQLSAAKLAPRIQAIMGL